MKAGTDRPKAIIMLPLGGDQGALSTIRSIGLMGIPVVVLSESRRSPALYSKYVREAHYLPNFTTDEQRSIKFLIEYGKNQNAKPVIIPTADPDLMLLNKYAGDLQPYYHVVIPPKMFVDIFVNKNNFYTFAKVHDFPIPMTYVFNNVGNLKTIEESISYPVILKPASPALRAEEIGSIFKYKKGLIVGSDKGLRDILRRISRIPEGILIQEYIPGDDSNHYCLDVYFDHKGKAVCSFVAQKIRVYPPYAGSGCYVRSVFVPELNELGINLLSAVGYKGLANMDFKKDSRTGKYVLLEINPRLSQWSILDTVCGINFAYIAYVDMVEKKVAGEFKQKVNICYVDFRRDYWSFRTYRKDGLVSLGQWLGSLVSLNNVYQYFCWRDIKPFIVEWWEILRSKIL